MLPFFSQQLSHLFPPSMYHINDNHMSMFLQRDGLPQGDQTK